MHFSEPAGNSILNSNFSDSPIYRVTGKGNELIMYGKKGGGTQVPKNKSSIGIFVPSPQKT